MTISISVFFKSVDILTIDISYRYIKQGYTRGNKGGSLGYIPLSVFVGRKSLRLWHLVIFVTLFRHLAGETEQELRREVELMQLAASGRGSSGQQQQLGSMEDASEGRKISQSWLNAAERVTRKTSVVRMKYHIKDGYSTQAD